MSLTKTHTFGIVVNGDMLSTDVGVPFVGDIGLALGDQFLLLEDPRATMYDPRTQGRKPTIANLDGPGLSVSVPIGDFFPLLSQTSLNVAPPEIKPSFEGFTYLLDTPMEGDSDEDITDRTAPGYIKNEGITLYSATHDDWPSLTCDLSGVVNGHTYPLNSTFTLSAEADYGSFEVSSVEFYDNGVLVYTAVSAPYQCVIPPITEPGIHVFKALAKAINSEGPIAQYSQPLRVGIVTNTTPAEDTRPPLPECDEYKSVAYKWAMLPENSVVPVTINLNQTLNITAIKTVLNRPITYCSYWYNDSEITVDSTLTVSVYNPLEGHTLEQTTQQLTTYYACGDRYVLTWSPWGSLSEYMRPCCNNRADEPETISSGACPIDSPITLTTKKQGTTSYPMEVWECNTKRDTGFGMIVNSPEFKKTDISSMTLKYVNGDGDTVWTSPVYLSQENTGSPWNEAPSPSTRLVHSCYESRLYAWPGDGYTNREWWLPPINAAGQFTFDVPDEDPEADVKLELWYKLKRKNTTDTWPEDYTKYEDPVNLGNSAWDIAYYVKYPNSSDTSRVMTDSFWPQQTVGVFGEYTGYYCRCKVVGDQMLDNHYFALSQDIGWVLQNGMKVVFQYDMPGHTRYHATGYNPIEYPNITTMTKAYYIRDLVGNGVYPDGAFNLAESADEDAAVIESVLPYEPYRPDSTSYSTWLRMAQVITKVTKPVVMTIQKRAQPYVESSVYPGGYSFGPRRTEYGTQYEKPFLPVLSARKNGYLNVVAYRYGMYLPAGPTNLPIRFKIGKLTATWYGISKRLELSTYTPDATIMYSLDPDASPGAYSTYTGPISITDDKVVPVYFYAKKTEEIDNVPTEVMLRSDTFVTYTVPDSEDTVVTKFWSTVPGSSETSRDVFLHTLQSSDWYITPTGTGSGRSPSSPSNPTDILQYVYGKALGGDIRAVWDRTLRKLTLTGYAPPAASSLTRIKYSLTGGTPDVYGSVGSPVVLTQSPGVSYVIKAVCQSRGESKTPTTPSVGTGADPAPVTVNYPVVNVTFTVTRQGSGAYTATATSSPAGLISSVTQSTYSVLDNTDVTDGVGRYIQLPKFSCNVLHAASSTTGYPATLEVLVTKGQASFTKVLKSSVVTPPFVNQTNVETIALIDEPHVNVVGTWSAEDKILTLTTNISGDISIYYAFANSPESDIEASKITNVYAGPIELSVTTSVAVLVAKSGVCSGITRFDIAFAGDEPMPSTTITKSTAIELPSSFDITLSTKEVVAVSEGEYPAPPTMYVKPNLTLRGGYTNSFSGRRPGSTKSLVQSVYNYGMMDGFHALTTPTNITPVFFDGPGVFRDCHVEFTSKDGTDGKVGGIWTEQIGTCEFKTVLPTIAATAGQAITAFGNSNNVCIHCSVNLVSGKGGAGADNLDGDGWLSYRPVELKSADETVSATYYIAVPGVDPEPYIRLWPADGRDIYYQLSAPAPGSNCSTAYANGTKLYLSTLTNNTVYAQGHTSGNPDYYGQVLAFTVPIDANGLPPTNSANLTAVVANTETVPHNGAHGGVGGTGGSGGAVIAFAGKSYQCSAVITTGDGGDGGDGGKGADGAAFSAIKPDGGNGGLGGNSGAGGSGGSITALTTAIGCTGTFETGNGGDGGNPGKGGKGMPGGPCRPAENTPGVASKPGLSAGNGGYSISGNRYVVLPWDPPPKINGVYTAGPTASASYNAIGAGGNGGAVTIFNSTAPSIGCTVQVTLGNGGDGSDGADAGEAGAGHVLSANGLSVDGYNMLPGASGGAIAGAGGNGGSGGALRATGPLRDSTITVTIGDGGIAGNGGSGGMALDGPVGLDGGTSSLGYPVSVGGAGGDTVVATGGSGGSVSSITGPIYYSHKSSIIVNVTKGSDPCTNKAIGITNTPTDFGDGGKGGAATTCSNLYCPPDPKYYEEGPNFWPGCGGRAGLGGAPGDHGTPCPTSTVTCETGPLDNTSGGCLETDPEPQMNPMWIDMASSKVIDQIGFTSASDPEEVCGVRTTPSSCTTSKEFPLVVARTEYSRTGSPVWKTDILYIGLPVWDTSYTYTQQTVLSSSIYATYPMGGGAVLQAFTGTAYMCSVSVVGGPWPAGKPSDPNASSVGRGDIDVFRTAFHACTVTGTAGGTPITPNVAYLTPIPGCWSHPDGYPYYGYFYGVGGNYGFFGGKGGDAKMLWNNTTNIGAAGGDAAPTADIRFNKIGTGGKVLDKNGAELPGTRGPDGVKLGHFWESPKGAY